jgi:hypothetical protein
MIALTAESKSYGNNGQYIAHVTGKDSKYTYRREFIGRKSERYTTAYVYEPGLYEICDLDKKGRKEIELVVVLARTAECPPLSEKADPDFVRLPIDEKDAVAIARRLSEGESLSEIVAVERASETGYKARIRDRREAKRASAAATVDSAIEHCWEVMQSLPEKEAKKVLAALKARVSPKATTPPAEEDTAAEGSNEASTTLE